MADNGVSGQVPEAVVDSLEVINVEKGDAELRAGVVRGPARIEMYRLPEDIVEIPVVIKPGKFVDDGQFPELGVHLSNLPVNLLQLLLSCLERRNIPG